MAFKNMDQGRRLRFMVAVGITASLVLAGCGSDDDDASETTAAASNSTVPTDDAASGSTEAPTEASGATDGDCATNAATALEPFAELPTDLPEDFVPLSTAPEPGKEVVYLAMSGVPQDITIGENVAEAAALVGWTSTTVTHDGTVEDLNRAFQQAINDGPDVIIVQGWPLASVQQSVAAAKDEGITVIMGGIADTPNDTDTTGFAGVVATQSLFEQYGEILANWVLSDSDCDGHVAAYGFNSPVINASGDTFVQTISDACPDCEATYTPVDGPDVGTPAVTQQIISAVQADPNIKYLAFPVGPVSTGVVAALGQAGITGVQIIGFCPDDNNLKALQDGTNSLMIACTSPLLGWVLFDAAVRVLDTNETWTATDYPIAVVTSENVPPDATTVDEVTFPTDFKEEFAALWQAG